MHFNSAVYRINISNLRTISESATLESFVQTSPLCLLFLEDLKDAISLKTSVPVCRQQLKGWHKPTHREALIDSTVLSSLKLSKENNIFLTDLTHEGFSDDVVFVSADPPTMYQLRIRYTNENRELNLNFPASRTLLEIKNDIYSVLKVPVRHQVWTGWPENSSNATKLSETGINPVHSLQLSRLEVENNFNHDA